jgi:hypothetical protein
MGDSMNFRTVGTLIYLPVVQRVSSKPRKRNFKPTAIQRWSCGPAFVTLRCNRGLLCCIVLFRTLSVCMTSTAGLRFQVCNWQNHVLYDGTTDNLDLIVP